VTSFSPTPKANGYQLVYAGTQHFESPFKGLVGSAFKLQACEKLGYHRTSGVKNCATYFP